MGKIRAIFRRLGNSTKNLPPPIPPPPIPTILVTPPTQDTQVTVLTQDTAHLNIHPSPSHVSETPPHVSETPSQIQARLDLDEHQDHGNRYARNRAGEFLPSRKKTREDGELRYSPSFLKPGYRASYFFFLDGVRFDIQNPSRTEGICEERRLEIMNCVREFVGEQKEAGEWDGIGWVVAVTVGGESYVVS